MLADRELFYFKFINDEDRRFVIEHGPLFLAGRIFVVRAWSESIELHREKKINSVPIWVKSDIPKQLWVDNGIGFISSIIGEPICTDDATANRVRLNYARFCVVVNTDFKFPALITVNMGNGDNADISLDYDWIPSVCEHCNTFGHTDAKCSRNKDVQPSKQGPLIKTKKKPQQRWTPKKNMQQGQSSCVKSAEGIPLQDGEEENPVIVVEDQQAVEIQAEKGTEETENVVLSEQDALELVVHSDEPLLQGDANLEIRLPSEEAGIVTNAAPSRIELPKATPIYLGIDVGHGLDVTSPFTVQYKRKSKDRGKRCAQGSPAPNIYVSAEKSLVAKNTNSFALLDEVDETNNSKLPHTELTTYPVEGVDMDDEEQLNYDLEKGMHLLIQEGIDPDEDDISDNEVIEQFKDHVAKENEPQSSPDSLNRVVKTVPVQALMVGSLKTKREA
ncbi:hypothetical protein IFM89_031976 [Coptis chinensis]|uniref:DUF4283 domain-containing protein n=1 Tax=Coptis chinensis TaxID=261450 RepID=A0A835LTF3_9MAGN|nr:hypothetical protein IFM89_031976 [Coptis chinensis]